MKPISIISLALNLALSTLAYATRFEFRPFNLSELPPLGEENTAFIETTTDTGINVPILEAVAAFQWRGLNSSTTGIVQGNIVELPKIVAPTFTSLEGLGLSGTMSWNLNSLGGIWSISSPIFEAPEHSPPLLGGTKYRLSDVGMESFWPLNYLFNESFQQGRFVAVENTHVPDAGSTLLLLALSLCALLVTSRNSPPDSTAGPLVINP